MSIVNYFVNMEINGVQISGGFSVNYLTSTVVGVNISTSDGLSFTNASLFQLSNISPTYQMNGADSSDSMNANYLALGYSDANQDGVTVSIGPETSLLTTIGYYDESTDPPATIAATPTL